MMSYVIIFYAGYLSQVVLVTQLRSDTPYCFLKRSAAAKTLTLKNVFLAYQSQLTEIHQRHRMNFSKIFWIAISYMVAISVGMSLHFQG